MSFHHTEVYAQAWAFRYWILAGALWLLVMVLLGVLVRELRADGRLHAVPSISRPSLSLPSPRGWLPGIRRGGGAKTEGGFVFPEEDDEPEPEVETPEPEPVESGGGESGDDGGPSRFDDFNPNWRSLGISLGLAFMVAAPLVVFYVQGAWPFGPWNGYMFAGLPAYWTMFFGMLVFSVLLLPIYVYFVAPAIPLLGGFMPRLTWIIASWAQGATIFDRASDGRYYARPMRKNDDDEVEMWVDGDWQEVPGNIEYVSRLAWKPVAVTWEKTDESVKEIIATDMGEDPVEYLTERGIMDRETAVRFQPSSMDSTSPDRAVADGGVAYDKWGAPIEGGEAQSEAEAVPNGGVEAPEMARYNILDYQGHAFQAFNPWPSGGDDDEYVIDTRKVMHKLAGAGEPGLIERAKDIALTDTAKTTRAGQVVGWLAIAGALCFGVGVAYFTV